MQASNEQLVLDMIDAVEQRDPDRLLAIWHPDVEFVWPPNVPGYGGRHSGDEAIAAMSSAFDQIWEPLQPTEALRRLNARVIASSGDEVVVEYRQQGVDDDGNVVGTDVLARYTLDDGRVRRLKMFYLDPDAVRLLIERCRGSRGSGV